MDSFRNVMLDRSVWNFLWLRAVIINLQTLVLKSGLDITPESPFSDLILLQDQVVLALRYGKKYIYELTKKKDGSSEDTTESFHENKFKSLKKFEEDWNYKTSKVIVIK